MSAPGQLVRSSRWKSGPSRGQRPLGSECCVAIGDGGCEAYTAIAWGVGLSHEKSDVAGAEGFHSLEGNERALCRHTPEVGAVCGKAARTVLCGGRAMKRTSLPLHRRT